MTFAEYIQILMTEATIYGEATILNDSSSVLRIYWAKNDTRFTWRVH